MKLLSLFVFGTMAAFTSAAAVDTTGSLNHLVPRCAGHTASCDTDGDCCGDLKCNRAHDGNSGPGPRWMCV